jgi:hypothetical protein
MKALIVGFLSATSLFATAQSNPAAPDAQAVLEHTKAAAVLVLTGDGAGRLHSIATGVVISKDGTILTAWHAIKGALAVQVRMANGDVFDRVELLGYDERRDVAALSISAGALPALTPGSTASLAQGDRVYAVTVAGGLTWSATEGIISAIRPAAEVPGAGTGFRLIQFTAPVAPGASGGALVDRTGALIGIIIESKGTAAFAIPIESVLGLPDFGPVKALGSGVNLQMPPPQSASAPQSGEAVAGPDPWQILKNARTIYISSDTMFVTPDMLDHALAEQPDWAKLGLLIVQDEKLADLLIKVDRLIFTHEHTYVISDKKTSIVLGAGRVNALEGILASKGIAKEIVSKFASVRLPEPPKE